MDKQLIYFTMKDDSRYSTIQKLINKQISELEASKIILVGVRQIRRMKVRAIKDGMRGIIHKSRGSPSNRKFDKDFKEKVISIVKEKYSDFKPTFTKEKLYENHNIKISKESLRKIMSENKLWKIKSKKVPKNNHYWRARKDNYGEMQQFDGSYHKWLEDRNGGKELCLLASIDDANGEITNAKFDINEGTIAVNNFWIEYFEKNGLPISIYLDKFSTYKINNPGACDNKDLMTQFQRSMNQVGVNLISAHSPQAKGRIERLFETLQDRLVKEMRLANISTVDGANKFLEIYIPKFNKQFGKVPAKKANLHKNLNKELKDNISQIFSIQTKRKINNDLTLSFLGNLYLLDKNQSIGIYKKEVVTIEEHLNGEMKISYKNHYLNFTKIIERPNKQAYIPKDKKIYNKPAANHPWKRMVYSSNVQEKSIEEKRREKLEELRENKQLNLDINKVVTR